MELFFLNYIKYYKLSLQENNYLKKTNVLNEALIITIILCFFFFFYHNKGTRAGS